MVALVGLERLTKNVSFSSEMISPLTLTVTVNVNGDIISELNETFFVNLSSPTNATILDTQGQATIINDDGVPGISIDDVTVTEGNAGTTNAVFTVSLSIASSQTITVDYTTANGTATLADSDYQSTSGTLTVAPGVTTLTITNRVNGDTKFEPDETYFVNLSNPINAFVADAQGMGTILNDDGQPTISINNVSANEGNSGTTNFTFTVSLSNPSYTNITVNYATADDTATAPSDYMQTNGTVTFAPGQTTTSITVVVNGDTTFEPNETFFVNLSGELNATIADNQGLGTIVNDDGLPAISINDVTVTEGNSGTTNAVFTVTLSNPSAQTITVTYTTADVTAKFSDKIGRAHV